MNHMLKWFKFEHLTFAPLRETSKLVAELAEKMDDRLMEGPEKSAGMRKLLEAKDCFVRAQMDTPPPAMNTDLKVVDIGIVKRAG